MWDVVDRYHTWLPFEIPKHNVENRYFPTGYAIKVMGANEYITKFSEFYDTESVVIEGHTKEEAVTAMTKWAARIHDLLLLSEKRKRK